MGSTRRGAVALLAVATAIPALWAAAASTQDKDFVAHVSQGGLYEVEAGRVAQMRGASPFVKDLGATEVHDHEGVNAGLKKIAAATGAPVQPGLNAEFSARLAKLKAVPAEQFDGYYVADMKSIHTKDHSLFVDEANKGTTPYKQFAHDTAVIVAGHLGALGAS